MPLWDGALSIDRGREFQVLNELYNAILAGKLPAWFSLEQLATAIGFDYQTQKTLILTIKDSMIKHEMLAENGKKTQGYKLSISKRGLEYMEGPRNKEEVPADIQKMDSEIPDGDFVDLSGLADTDKPKPQ